MLLMEMFCAFCVIHILIYEVITGLSIEQYCRLLYFSITRSQSKVQVSLHLCELKPLRSSSFQILYLDEALNMHADPLNKFCLIGIQV